VEAAVDQGSLGILEPSPASVAVVESKLKEIKGQLSGTDVKVLALALDLSEKGQDPMILTDDYGLQNLARLLSLSYSSVMTSGIRSIFQWKNSCPGCGREYASDVQICPVCGSKLRRTTVREPC
jgi:UPF0271 protein